MDHKINELKRNTAIDPQIVMQNPAQSMERQAESMFNMLSVMDKMESRFMAIAERRAGLRKDDEPVPASSSTMELVKAIAPMLGPIVQRIFSAPAVPPMVARPAALPMQPPAPAASVAASTQAEPMNLPQLTPDEQAKLAPSVRALKGYASVLAGLPSDELKTDHDLADGLGSYIPPAFYPAMLDLCDLVILKGPGVLGYIDPALNHPRWPSILSNLRDMLREAMRGEE